MGKPPQRIPQFRTDGPYTDRKDKTWKYSSVLNEMQLTDRIRTENCLYNVLSDHNSLSNRTDREAVLSDRISLSILDNPLMNRFLVSILAFCCCYLKQAQNS